MAPFNLAHPVCFSDRGEGTVIAQQLYK